MPELTRKKNEDNGIKNDDTTIKNTIDTVKKKTKIDD